jgi:hypothetical protein
MCVNELVRVQRQEVELESRHVTLKMDKDLQYSNGLVATGKFRCIVHISEKGWRQIGQMAVLLINEHFGSCTT